MTRKLTRENLQDPDEMRSLLQKARIKAYGTIREQAELIMAERKSCDKRGYHRVESKPKDGNPMICYDCELWFDKKFAREVGLKYRVEAI